MNTKLEFLKSAAKYDVCPECKCCLCVKIKHVKSAEF